MAAEYLSGGCHTHLDKYPAAEIPEILERADEAGVGMVVCVGTTAPHRRQATQC